MVKGMCLRRRFTSVGVWIRIVDFSVRENTRPLMIVGFVVLGDKAREALIIGFLGWDGHAGIGVWLGRQLAERVERVEG